MPYLPKRPCLDCGALTTKTRCVPCQRAKWREQSRVKNLKRPGAARTSLPDRVKRRDGGRCVVCGSTDRIQAHHVIPLAKGGLNDERNMLTLCWTHHQQAHRKREG